MRSKKKFWAVLLAVLMMPILCCPCTMWGGKRLLNWISFEIAWRVVNATYFDPTFGGVDWRQMHDRCQRQVMFASDSNYYRLINDMLWELDVSHMGVFQLS